MNSPKERDCEMAGRPATLIEDRMVGSSAAIFDAIMIGSGVPELVRPSRNDLIEYDSGVFSSEDALTTGNTQLGGNSNETAIKASKKPRENLLRFDDKNDGARDMEDNSSENNIRGN